MGGRDRLVATWHRKHQTLGVIAVRLDAQGLSLDCAGGGAVSAGAHLFGVPYMYAMFNMVVTAVVFLLSKNLLSGLLVFPIHAVGYVLTLRDDRIFAILQVKMSKCPPRATGVWGINTYRP